MIYFDARKKGVKRIRGMTPIAVCGIPLAALGSKLIQEPLARLYSAGAWACDPECPSPLEDEAAAGCLYDWYTMVHTQRR
jgi:hypothetical protein